MANERKLSTKQEKLIAKELTDAGLKTRTTINSGSTWFDPADGINEMFLFDAKRTAGKSFSVKRSDLEKLSQEAFFRGRIPILPCSFDGYKNYFVIEDYHLYNLIKRMMDAEAEVLRLREAP